MASMVAILEILKQYLQGREKKYRLFENDMLSEAFEDVLPLADLGLPPVLEDRVFIVT